MNPKIEVYLRENQRALRLQSFKIYLKLLTRLLQENREYTFLEPLASSLRARDFGALYRLADSLSEQSYPDATQHFVANQFTLLIKKYPWPSQVLDLKPRERAVNTFLSSERRCKRVTRKFSLLSVDRSRDRFKREATIARNFIRNCIGSTPNYRSWSSQCDFGPGASIGVHGNATNYLAKLSADRWTVSPGAIHHAFLGFTRNFHLMETLFPKNGAMYSYDLEAAFATYMGRVSVIGNNKISFVPKTAKTHRSIAVEPLLNGFVQKGIDSLLRSRLKAIGTDLADQGLNQRLAREGSLDDSEEGFVTIDLKSASDSISTGIVKYLLPDDWFRLLSRTRSPSYELDGEVNSFEKFCSMGNGFCFPLETLIFVSACFSIGCGENAKDFTVYGDDIVVRKKFAPRLLELLSHWGFKMNSDKTFLEGPFRESCGKDWFGGEDVRPFTLDYALDSVESIFKFLNLTRRSERTSSFFLCVRNLVIGFLHPNCRWFRPLSGTDDSAINSTGDEHLTAPNCRYKGDKWVWFELSHPPKTDWVSLDRCKDEPWLVGVAVRGPLPIGFGRYRFLPEVTLRRETKTKIVRKGYTSNSNWLPSPNDRRESV